MYLSQQQQRRRRKRERYTRSRVGRRQGAEEEVPTTESISTEGDAVQEDGYYLCGLHGYVAVYLSDKTTIYELTEIPLTDLPEEIQQEIIKGKYVETAEELYAFLENYSS